MGLIARFDGSGDSDAGDADRRIELACPCCARVVRVAPSDIAQRRPAVCPAGHPVVPPACAGLGEVLAFLGDLDRATRKTDEPPWADAER